MHQKGTEIVTRCKCGSKCPSCWTDADSWELYDSLLKQEETDFLNNRIGIDVYAHNIQEINKYNKPTMERPKNEQSNNIR